MKAKTSTVAATLVVLALAACGGNDPQETYREPGQIGSGTQAASLIPDSINELLNKHTCLTCHDASSKVVGPAYTEVAKRNYTNEQIVALIYKPKPEHWPEYVPPMAPLPNVPKEDALKIAQWINSLK